MQTGAEGVGEGALDAMASATPEKYAKVSRNPRDRHGGLIGPVPTGSELSGPSRVSGHLGAVQLRPSQPTPALTTSTNLERFLLV